MLRRLMSLLAVMGAVLAAPAALESAGVNAGHASPLGDAQALAYCSSGGVYDQNGRLVSCQGASLQL